MCLASEERPDAPAQDEQRQRPSCRLQNARRCLARCKGTGKPCMQPAMKNGRCKLHGGKSPGGKKGNRNAWKHGRYSAEAIADRKRLAALLRRARETVKAMKTAHS